MPKRLREPADPANGPVAAFGFELRTLRQQAQLSYTAIAQASFFSKSAVHAVDQGHQLPSVNILHAFVTACGDEPQPWIDRRNRLAEDLVARKPDPPAKISLREQGLPAPDPATVSTVLEFNDGLKRLREWSGLTYQQIEDLSSKTRRIARSTLCGAFKRGTLPRRSLVASYLQALGLPEADKYAWLAAWQALRDGQPVPGAGAPVLPTVHDWLATLPADADPAGPWPVPAVPVVLRISTVAGAADETQASIEDDYVIPTYLPSSEIRDWAFRDGQWEAIDTGHAAPARSAATTPRSWPWPSWWFTVPALVIIAALTTAVIILARQ